MKLYVWVFILFTALLGCNLNDNSVQGSYGSSDPKPSPVTSLTPITKITQTYPNLTESKTQNPRFEVEGVAAGDTVVLYADENCLYPLQSLTSSGDTLEFELSLGEGEYEIYSARYNNGVSSPCSSVTKSYTVDLLNGPGFPIGGVGNTNRSPLSNIMYAMESNQGGILTATLSHISRIHPTTGQVLWTRSGLNIPDKSFDTVAGLAEDSDGNIYVALFTHHKVIKLNQNGEYLGELLSPGAGDGHVTFPAGVAINSNNQLLVSDSANNRVQITDLDGNFISKLGAPGTGDLEFNQPSGLSIDSLGNIVVFDYFNFRVQVFSTSGSFIREFGSNGTGDGQFQNAFGLNGVAVLGNGDYIATDESAHRLQIFDDQGNFKSKFGSMGTGASEFNTPANVTVSNGKVYVADFNNGRVSIFDESASPIRQIERPSSVTLSSNWRGIAIDPRNDDFIIQGGNEYKRYTSVGVYVEDVSYPVEMTSTWIDQIAVASNGNILITQGSGVNSNRINIIQPDGTFVVKIGEFGTGNGKFNQPEGVVIDSSGNIFVADTANDRIQKFNSSYVYQSQWDGSATLGKDLDNPSHLAVDASDNIYVADTSNHRIQKFDNSGNHIMDFGSFGANDGELDNPNGVAVDQTSGRIYVADTFNDRVQVFDASGTFLYKLDENNTTMDFGTTGAPSTVVVDGAGNLYVKKQNEGGQIYKFNSSGEQVYE